MGCVYSRACIGEACVPRDGRVKHQSPKSAANNNAGAAVAATTASTTSAAGYNHPVYSPASSSSGSEVHDQFNQLGVTRDPEQLGINRLSRVSSQFLPPDGSRTVKVPSANYELKYSYLSQRGYYPDALDKANQDSFCIHTPFGSSPDDHFFGVFDGHGEFGAQCSQFVKRKLCENLLRNGRFHTDAVEACHSAFVLTNTQLHADNVDDSMSGTTAITVLVRGRTVYAANSGDSRAVLAERRGNELVAVDLSVDQTPFRSDECERVKMCGARVMTLDQIEGLKNPEVQCWGTEEADDGDPPRLWVQNGMYPGTAFSRSIGDSIAETIGVVPNPEIVVVELTRQHPFFVIASDGVFEFLSSQTVVDMVAKYKDPRDACAAIVAESYRLWLQYETRTDDITVIVVHINDLTGGSITQSTTQGASLKPSTPHFVEVTGSESPSALTLNSMNHRVRQELSRARLRAIENSLENGQLWVPPSPAHRKTWEEEAHIERALRDHFLFRKLTDSQCQVLLDCMQRVEVHPGEVVVKQGGEGECFYIVGSGEFEVFATQEEKNGEVPRVLQHYTAEKVSSFGELALMYNKPLQASVRAVTSGTLWALKREDFRGILMSEFSNLSSLKLLRSIDILSRLTILQLSRIADSLFEISFSNGQKIVDENEGSPGLCIIQKGKVRIDFEAGLLNSSSNVGSLKLDNLAEDDNFHSDNWLSLEKSEGNYFGEWTLLGEHIGPLSAVAVGDCVCSFLTKEKFDSVVGPLTNLSQVDEKLKGSSSDLAKESAERTSISTPLKVCLSDLEWRKSLYSADYSDIGLVLLRGSEKILSLKRFTKQKVETLGKKEQVLKEKNLIKSVSPSAFVPQVLCTCIDRTHAGILLNACLVCPLASILHTALDEPSAQFCSASVVIALEDLHKNGILYRGVSPDVLMVDRTGHIQLVDFRFGKKLSDNRTFTICGMADFLAPEIVQGKGHGFPADWWALGVLIYFMLRGEKPFGSWRENELDTYTKVAKGQLTIPQSFSPEAVEIITKLLDVDETTRLGNQGADSIKNHPWFDGVDWEGMRDGNIPVPHDITARVTQHSENNLSEECAVFAGSSYQDEEDGSSPEWLDDW